MNSGRNSRVENKSYSSEFGESRESPPEEQLKVVRQAMVQLREKERALVARLRPKPQEGVSLLWSSVVPDVSAAAATEDEISVDCTTCSSQVEVPTLVTSHSSRTSIRKRETQSEAIGTEQSAVESVEASPSTSVAPLSSTSQEGLSSTVIDVKPKPGLKRRPGYRSGPTILMDEITRKAVEAIDDAADKPVLNEATESISKPKKLGWAARNRARKEGKEVFSDLYWHLKLQSFMEPKDLTTAKRMKMKALQFLGDHDLNGLSLEYRYKRLASTLAAVMEVSLEEQEFLASLSSRTGEGLRQEYNEFVTNGKIAGTGLFGGWCGSRNYPITANRK